MPSLDIYFSPTQLIHINKITVGNYGIAFVIKLVGLLWLTYCLTKLITPRQGKVAITHS